MDIKVNANIVVVFDLDDTLYNEMEYLQSAYKAIAQRIDKQNWQSLYARMFSLFRSKQDVFDYVSKQYNETKNQLLKEYRNHEPTITLFEGALGLFKAIKINNGKIGVITDGRSTTQRAKLRALGIIDLVDKIVISEEVGSEKPNEKNYQIIEDTFADCNYMYISDNLRKDFIAPKKFGWKTVGRIDNGLNMHFDGYKYFDEKHEPDEFIESFTDISVVKS